MINVLTEKSDNQNINPQSSDLDFDWLTSDPGQSNIPIRKRGRTRHKLNVSSEISGIRKEIERPCVSEKTKDGMISALIENSYSSSKDSITKPENDRTGTTANMTQLGQLKMMSECQSKSEIVHENTEAEVNTSDLSLHLSELPDPLANGKFDESQLILQDKIARKTQKVVTPSIKTSKKTMVTRYRGRPKTMTVLEAASRKKAKYMYDIPSDFTSRKTAKDKSLQRKTVKVVKSKPRFVEQLKLENTNPVNADAAIHDTTDAENALNEGKTSIKTKPTENLDSKQYRQTSTPILKASKVVPAKKRQGLSQELESNGQGHVTNLKEKFDDSAEPPQIDSTIDDGSLAKKPRLR